MVEHTRVVVIGGGVVGCSCLYHLAGMGWTDAVLVEQNELTSGSTWHAAGNCPTFATTWGLLKLQQYSAALYCRLGGEVDYPINYHVTGSVRLAHTEERMNEYRYVLGLAHANGLQYELLTPSALRDKHAFVEVDGRVLLGRRHQHGAVRDKRKAEVRLVVAERPEEDQIILVPPWAEMIEKGRPCVQIAQQLQEGSGAKP